MKNSSRHLVRAICAIAFAAGCGVGIATAAEIIIERGAMPAARVEVIPAPPGAGYNWVPGHWAWRGAHWEWIPGHHILGVVPARPAEVVEVIPVRPSPGHLWVKGHHVFEGGAWVWRPGVWVRL
jgi:hypothetical protein